MKTVRDACQLQPNALSVKLSDQIGQLDELISAEGNGRAFFDRTFITQGMKGPITEGNLAGKALDSNDFVVYETATGKLFHDADGSGTPLLIATLTGLPAISSVDLFVT